MSNFDRSKCIFCQRVLAKYKMVCPADSKQADVGLPLRIPGCCCSWVSGHWVSAARFEV